ncbi:hypothetical protein HYX18_00815 [Candidatus Woesearchaeota archaeon]|nr:hypothetical protein [Candidatus Woesearchaeota archaeon]
MKKDIEEIFSEVLGKLPFDDGTFEKRIFSLKKLLGVIKMDIYVEEERNELFESDEIDDFELGFMDGYCDLDDLI